MINSVSAVKRVGGWLWLTAALLIIGTVILVVIGRQIIPRIDELRVAIETAISDSVGMDTQLGELRGDWPGLIPIVEVAHIEISAPGKGYAIQMGHARADLDLFNTIKYRSPIWRELVVDSVTITLSEDSGGRWGLKGFANNTDGDLKIILNPLIYSRMIRLENVRVNLEFFSGKFLQVSGNGVRLENDNNFHRAELSVRLSDQDNSAYLVVEGVGDPADLEAFYANGYFRLDDLNVSEPLVDLAQSFLPEVFSELSSVKVKTSGQIWFDIHPGGSLDFAGSVQVSEVPLNWLADLSPITNINTELTGWLTPGSDWGARLQGFNFAWSDSKTEPLDLVFTRRLGSQWQDFDITVNHLDLTLLSSLLLKTRIASPKILAVLDLLRPQGDLNALTLGRNQTGYYVAANLDDITLKPYKGVPGIKGIDGYLEMQAAGGLFYINDVDGFDVLFPMVYKDYLAVEAAEGTIFLNWGADRDKLNIRSAGVTAKVDAGEVDILFSVAQTIPSNGRAAEFNIIIGGRDLDASYADKYLPYKLPADVSRWLKTSIIGASVKEVGMLFRGGPPKKDRTAKTTQLMFKTEDMYLDYHPDWLGLRDVDALVLVDDQYIEGVATGGQIGGVDIISAEVLFGNTLSAPNLLTVDAEVNSGFSDAIDLLAQSPIGPSLGPLPSWDYTGTANGRLHLEVPVKQLSGQQNKGAYQVKAELNNASLSIPNTAIAVTNITGELGFSLERGLFAEDINGEIWQQPLTASFFKTDADQFIALSTTIVPKSLNQLIDFPWDEVLVGDIPIKGLATIKQGGTTSSPVTLQLTSQMQATEIKLPQPLDKSVGDKLPLDLTLFFDPDFKRLAGTIGPELLADLRFSDFGLTQGLVSYDRSISMPAKGELLVASFLPTTDLKLWQPVGALFANGLSGNNKRLNTVFDLEFDQLEVATFTLRDIAAQVRLSDEIIKVEFSTDLADGGLLLPVNDQSVLNLSLSRLSLPLALLEGRTGGAPIDPRKFLAADIAVDQLMLGDTDWGSVSFQLRPEISGAAFNSIKGNLGGLRPGLLDKDPTTEFFWHFDGESYSSRLVGPVPVDNIALLMDSFDIPTIVDSQSGELVFDLAWPDQPWNISRENINGTFKIELNEGSFYKSPSGAGAALKVVSLFNFANWLKRLQLDFSDVTNQNLAYHHLNAEVRFGQGVASFSQPLQMKMPSGRMSMAGNFDMVNETVDGKLVATLPVATNLPWVVALLGGLPAAAGVYLTGKLVEKQVDQMSSISYNLAGPWADIEVTVDKIFAEELKRVEIDKVETTGSRNE